MVVTFHAVVNEWLPIHQSEVRPVTYHHAAERLRVHILPSIGNMPIDGIDGDTITAYLDSKREHLCGSTLKKHYHLISQAMRYAHEKGYIDTVPLVSYHYPRSEVADIPVYTPTEIELIISNARPKWLGDAVLLAFRTGMRRGEVMGLQWGDINWADKFLTVRRSIAAISPHDIFVGAPKTRAGIRRISLDKQSIAMLSKRKSTATQKWVFEQKNRDIPSPWYIPKLLKQACLSAGVPYHRFHGLRHTHATVLLGAGVNPRIVQARLGHADIQVTLQTYSHVLPTMQNVVVDIFDRIP